MFKKILLVVVLVAAIGVLVFGAATRTLAKTTSEDTALYGNGGGGRGTGLGDGYYGSTSGTEMSNLPPASSSSLTADETAALLYMREEEKLAHDVYVAMAAKWNLPVFQNISQSEQVHAEAVKTLLDRYGVADPTIANGEGVFADPTLQSLYQKLISDGSQSLEDALKVGATIEEIDILDLEERLSQTDKADLQQVFASLKSGSSNHLNAFVTTLSRQTGETYQPQYLSLEAYQAIIGTSAVGGGSGGGYRGGRP